jgi:hypothetical protein
VFYSQIKWSFLFNGWPPVSSLITRINTLLRRLTSQTKHQFGLSVSQHISYNEHLSATSSYRRRRTKLVRAPQRIRSVSRKFRVLAANSGKVKIMFLIYFNTLNHPRINKICLFVSTQKPPIGPWPPHLQGFYITHNDVARSVGLLWTSDQLVAELIRSIINKQPTKCTSLFMIHFIQNILTDMFRQILRPSSV